MDYLKKYRKEAGLIGNENRTSGGDLVTPTKETLDYLTGAVKGQKVT